VHATYGMRNFWGTFGDWVHTATCVSFFLCKLFELFNYADESDVPAGTSSPDAQGIDLLHCRFLLPPQRAEHDW
jgi:hypothetical protein